MENSFNLPGVSPTTAIVPGGKVNPLSASIGFSLNRLIMTVFYPKLVTRLLGWRSAQHRILGGNLSACLLIDLDIYRSIQGGSSI